MATLTSFPFAASITPIVLHGDIGDRSIGGVSYAVRLHCEDLVVAEVTAVDDAPDRFEEQFRSALSSSPDQGRRDQSKPVAHRGRRPRAGAHRCDGLHIGVFPLLSLSGVDWHSQPCEPARFKGDPDNVFKVIVGATPKVARQSHADPGVGGEVAVVLPVYRREIEDFLAAWLAEIRALAHSDALARQDGENHLMRWIAPVEASATLHEE